MERSVSARSDRNILDHLWRWTSLTGRSGPTETCHSIYKNSRSPWCDRNFGQNVNETLRSGWKLTFYEKLSSSFPWLVLLPVGQAQWKAPLRFNVPDHPDRVPQIAVDAWDRCSMCLRRGANLSAIVSQTDPRPLQIIWKPGLS